MKALYLECGMGAAGDMLTAALLELLPDPDAFIARLNALGIPGVSFVREASEKCGIQGTHVRVLVDGAQESAYCRSHEHAYEHEHEHAHEHAHEHPYEHAHEYEHTHEYAHEHAHHHRGTEDIARVVESLPVSEKIRSDVLAVYALIAQAESDVHGVRVSDIHFHEVGTMDAIADVTAVCMLMDALSPDSVVVSPICVGSGSVRCAHGVLPVPAPATARILRGVPIYGGDVRGELCTPTGAALLKHFATSFGEMPVMKTHAIGYGMGTKDFAAANCVRVFLGETQDSDDRVAELRCNLDDMTPEAAAFAQEQLLAAGALDVFFVPVQMKKSRPGVVLCVLCRETDKDRMVRLIFRHTTTIGVRETLCRRYTLERTVESVPTALGDVRRKTSVGYGVTRVKYENEDVARIAAEQDLSLSEAIRQIERSDP